MIKEYFREFLFRRETSTSLSKQTLKSIEHEHDVYSAIVQKLLTIISEQKQSALEVLLSR